MAFETMDEYHASDAYKQLPGLEVTKNCSPVIEVDESPVLKALIAKTNGAQVYSVTHVKECAKHGLSCFDHIRKYMVQICNGNNDLVLTRTKTDAGLAWVPTKRSVAFANMKSTPLRTPPDPEHVRHRKIHSMMIEQIEHKASQTWRHSQIIGLQRNMADVLGDKTFTQMDAEERAARNDWKAEIKVHQSREAYHMMQAEKQSNKVSKIVSKVRHDDEKHAGPVEKNSNLFEEIASFIPEYDTMVWAPHLPPGPSESEYGRQFNTWDGYAFEKLLPKNGPPPPVDVTLIQPILDHIKNTFCKGDQAVYEYFLKWRAHLLQNPSEKCGVAMVNKSDLEGSGRGAYQSFMQSIMGENLCIDVTEDGLTADFNAHISNKLIIHCPELGNMGSAYKAAAKLRTMITDEFGDRHLKGVDRQSVRQYFSLMGATNEDRAVREKDGGRRYFILESCCKNANNPTYHRPLLELYKREDVQLHFALHLRSIDIKGFHFGSNIPDTEARRVIQSGTQSAVIKFLSDVMANAIKRAELVTSRAAEQVFTSGVCPRPADRSWAPITLLNLVKLWAKFANVKGTDYLTIEDLETELSRLKMVNTGDGWEMPLPDDLKELLVDARSLKNRRKPKQASTKKRKADCNPEALQVTVRCGSTKIVQTAEIPFVKHETQRDAAVRGLAKLGMHTLAPAPGVPLNLRLDSQTKKGDCFTVTYIKLNEGPASDRPGFL